MRRLKYLLMAGLLIAPLACDEGQEGVTEPPPEPPDPGNVLVAVSVEQTPLIGVTVSLAATGSQQVGVTDGNGFVNFPSVPPGSATVTISGFPAGITFASTTATVTVPEGGTAAASFAGAYIRTAAVSGEVTVDGDGISNVAVTATGPETFTTTTGADGAYSITGLRAGSYIVAISGYPADIQFPFTQTSVQLAVGGSEVVDFDGTAIIEPATVSIESITKGGMPIDLTDVYGQIEVAVNIGRGNQDLDRVEVLIDGKVVASQGFAAGSAEAAPQDYETVTLNVPTNQVTMGTTVYAGGLPTYVPVVFNGGAFVTADLYTAGASAPVSSNAVPVVMNNPDHLMAPLAGLGIGPTLADPFFPDPSGDFTWYASTVDFGSVIYIAFSGIVPDEMMFYSGPGDCEVAGTVTGTATAGAVVANQYDCDGYEGAVGVDFGEVAYDPEDAPEGPDGSDVTRPGEGEYYQYFSKLGAQFELEDEDRWYLISADEPDFDDVVYIDLLAPQEDEQDEIGYLEGCSPTIPNPGCWINDDYDLPGDFWWDDYGTDVATVNVYEYIHDPITPVCTMIEVLPADLDEVTDPETYDVCSRATDNIGNVSDWVRGYNVFGLDRTAPTIDWVGTYDPDFQIEEALPLDQVLDWEIQDNNSGLDMELAMVITYDHTLNEDIGTCEIDETFPIEAGAGTAPRSLATPFEPDFGCAVPGVYRWFAAAEDRAGNHTDSDVNPSFMYDPGTPEILAVDLMPFYGGGLDANFRVFGTDDVDIIAPSVGLAYMDDAGNDIYLRFGPLFFPTDLFGTAWDFDLYTETPPTGVVVTLPGTYVLGRVVTDDEADGGEGSLASAFEGWLVQLSDPYGHLGSFDGDFLAPFIDTDYVTTYNPWYDDDGIIAWEFIDAETQCRFEYSTPTNGPTVPDYLWLLDGVAPNYDVIDYISSDPVLVSDNGEERLYRYTMSGDCATAIGANPVAMFVDEYEGIPIGYIVGYTPPAL